MMMKKRGLTAILVAAMLLTSVYSEAPVTYAAGVVQTEESGSTAEMQNEITAEPEAGDESAAEYIEDQGTDTSANAEAEATDEEDMSADVPDGNASDDTTDMDQSVSEDADDSDPDQDGQVMSDEAGQDEAEQTAMDDAADANALEEEEIAEDLLVFEAEEVRDSNGVGTLSGEGTEESPYLINDSNDLLLWRDQMLYSSSTTPKYAILTADIELNSSLDNESLVMWNRTSAVTTFYGVFDGKGYTIKNLYMSRPNATGTDPLGLADKNAGVIKNLVIENAKIEYGTNITRLSNASKVGVFAGLSVYEPSGGGIIENCTLKGTVSISGKLCYVGGFVGSLNYGSVTGCKNLATDFSVETVYYGYHDTGGIAGKMEGKSDSTVSIENCQTGTEDGTSVIRGAIGIVGGITGTTTSNAVSISNCRNYAKIVGAPDTSAVSYLGGIVGSSSYGAVLDHCVNYGQLEGPKSSSVGGIGCLCSSTTISNCINKGTLSGGSVAGIVYQAGTGSSITKCANFGKLIHAQTMGSTVQMGGIAATVTGRTISNCYNCGKMEDATGDLRSGQFGGIAAVINPSAANLIISNCYNVGALIDDSSFTQKASGGIVGEVTKKYAYSTGTITLTDCYADSAANAKDETEEVDFSKCYQKTSDELQVQSTYADWDFTDTWAMGEGVYKYPVLKGLEEPESMPEKPGSSDNPNKPDDPGDTTKTYTVRFDKNAPDATGTMADQSFKYGEAQKLSANQYARAGFIFSGWNTNAAGGGTSYADGATVKNLTAENGRIVTLYAQWLENIEEKPQGEYTVTFEAKNGTDPVSVPVRTGGKLRRPETPVLAGYTFKGWYKEDSCVNLWDFENGTVWNDFTLYAGWDAADGAEGIPETDQIATGSQEGFWMAKVGTYTYTGAAIKPAVQVYFGSTRLRAGTDYTVKYTNNKKAGTADIKVTGKGAYKDNTPLTTTFTIKKRDIAGSSVTKTYTNAYAANTKRKKNPSIVFSAKYGTGTLKNKTDYVIKVYDKNGSSEVASWYEAGIYTLKVEGTGNYEGTYSAKFMVINGTPVSKLSVAKIAEKDRKYNAGNPVEPKPKIKSGRTVLTEGTDYTLSYRNNTEIGTAVLIITGAGSYFGSREVNFSITGLALKKAKFEQFVGAMEYNGTYQKQQSAVLTYGSGSNKVTLKDNDALPEGSTGRGDYTIVSYENNKNVGKAVVTYKGMGQYTGLVRKTFKITARSIKSWDADSCISVKGNAETGEGLVVTVTDQGLGKTLVNDVDYKVSRKKKNNTVTITITGKGNYKDKLVKTL